MLYIFIAFCSGFIFREITIRIHEHLDQKKNVLRIDCSNPEKDIYRLEIGDMDRLLYKKRITLLIDKKANLSQD